MYSHRLVAGLAATTVLLVAAGDGSAAPGRVDRVARTAARTAPDPVDVDGDCHDDLPADPEPAPGAPIRLKVLLAVNSNVSTARGAQLAAALRRLYAPAGIDVRVTTRRVRLTGVDVRELIAKTRKTVGGTVPRGFDVVHLVTAANLTSQGSDSSIGLADCIGGIRHPKRAFSVSELSADVRGTSLGPVTGSGDEEARSVAHEIGHLLGARHEHANCAQGAPAARPTDSTCTIMFLAAPSSDVFGVVEGAVVRGYARRYAG